MQKTKQKNQNKKTTTTTTNTTSSIFLVHINDRAEEDWPEL